MLCMVAQVGSLQSDGESAEDEVGDVLFQFAKSSVTIGLDRGLLRYLVRHGAQPQRKINVSLTPSWSFGIVRSLHFVNAELSPGEDTGRDRDPRRWLIHLTLQSLHQNGLHHSGREPF